MHSQLGENLLLNSKSAYSSYELSTLFTRTDGVTGEVSGKISKTGNTVTIAAQIGQVNITSGYKTIGRLTNYKPSANQVNTVGFLGAGTAQGEPVRICIETTGNIVVYKSTTGNSTLRFVVTYVTNSI